MSDFYSDEHRNLQEGFETTKLADRLEDIIVKDVFEEGEKSFLEAQTMFFLSTITPDGGPTVSYKGGGPGFVKILDEKTLAFPSYDGNGMFYSMGNIMAKPEVGLLFINFETPQRMRVHGKATVSKDDPLLADYKEAELIVRVNLSRLWINCPRYIPKMDLKEQSHYVPEVGKETPLAGWKRVDLVQDVLAPKDVGRPEKEGGVITIEDWVEDIEKGQG